MGTYMDYIYARYDVQNEDLELYASADGDLLQDTSILAEALGTDKNLMQDFIKFSTDYLANYELEQLIAKYGKSKIRSLLS